MKKLRLSTRVAITVQQVRNGCPPTFVFRSLTEEKGMETEFKTCERCGMTSIFVTEDCELGSACLKCVQEHIREHGRRLGRQVCEKRKLIDLTRGELAQEWGVSEADVAALESGEQAALPLHVQYLEQRFELSPRHKSTHSGTVAFYVFADILGFSSSVQNKWSKQLLNEFLEAFDRGVSALRNGSQSKYSSTKTFEVLVFTDCVALACPLGDFEKDLS